MSLVALDGTPLIPILAGRQFVPQFAAAGQIQIDAANEACIMIGRIVTEDGGSHTIDNGGSIGWRTGSVTFANAGTTFKVGIAAVDASNGPPMRATNSTDVITFDVSKSMTGGGGLVTANAWQTHVPDSGTKTIANGDVVAICMQMTARGGADVVNVSAVANAIASARPGITGFLGGSYADQSRMPNAIITFSDGKLGWIAGGFVFTTSLTTQTWNNTSGTKEYGNFFQLPFPVKVYGIFCGAAVGGDLDLVLYSDPLGTPVAEKTASIDLNVVASAVDRPLTEIFSSPFTLNANMPCAAIYKPTSATNVSANYLSLDSSSHQKAFPAGTNCYAINRNTGAFAAQNSNKDRFAIGLLVGAFEHGVWPSGYLGV